eukprot:CAMPEP_0117743804 /NCGR_PEP_ID=MMETSP0947-20121206/6365_1 /TAXON_ID=44440 /ORGANISM="Chattonella subsalsa, Strain CCMP2191" /LENGTH=576 /DNA_ID=CAMNT_0005560599 /DNA_START=188 /DNA_END=1918 /DNA_ORIENTATION=+
MTSNSFQHFGNHDVEKKINHFASLIHPSQRPFSAHSIRAVSDMQKQIAFERLQKLTLPELKAAYKKLGGKPGSLRKGELVDKIIPLLEAQSMKKKPPPPLQQQAVPPPTPVSPINAQTEGPRRPTPRRNYMGTSPGRMHSLSTVYTDEDEEEYIAPDPSYNRSAVLDDIAGSDMELTFLGTASCIPGTTRSVSCTALRREGEVWMFDVGEGSQIQIQKSMVRPSRITKIFITHAHGDHTFGLPGILCLMGQDKEMREGPVEIYGPEGIRDYIVACTQLTYSRIVPPFIVHELKDIPFLHDSFCREPEKFPQVNLGFEYRFGEVGRGRTIYPDERGIYKLFEENGVTGYAAAMQHTIPCVGYCVEEASRSGQLQPELVLPHLMRNTKALKEAGHRDPMKLMKTFKNLGADQSFEFPDGTVITGAEVVTAPRRGRKVVICGDTCDASRLAPVAKGADVVVHEATNAHLTPWDQGTYESTEQNAIAHGHSTPQMAAKFAEKVGARRLILTHFSPRYKGDDDVDSVTIMRRIENQARKAGGYQGNDVIAAWDLLRIPIPYESKRENVKILQESESAEEDQ